MGRAPCCDKANVKRGPWSPEEDAKLKEYIEKYGTGGNWIALPQRADLRRCGKSCRLRWLNYLRPDIKHGDFTEEEDRIICNLYASIGSRWSIIAARLPGRTDNDIKNYWNTKLKKKIMGTGMGRGTITAQRNSYPHHTSFSSFLQTASPSSSCFTSYLSYNCSSNTYESMQTSSSITGLQHVPISTSCLQSNMSSLSTASSFLHPQQDFQSLMQHPRVKESVVVGSEASCSSSDGSTVNNLNQIIHGKELEYELKDSTQDDKILSYVCNDGVEETQKFMAPDCGNLNGKVNKSTASWRENYPFDLGLEEIKQLISTSSCNSSILFDDDTLE